MSSAAPPSFLTYLTCDPPAGYPFRTATFPEHSLVLKERERRQFVHQQSVFLETARPFAVSHPWIAYLASLKNEAVLAVIPVDSTPFIDVADQKFLRDSQQKWKALRLETQAAIDQATALSCERLVLLQREASKIDECEKKLRTALDAGFTALKPLPPKPPEPVHGWLAEIAGAVAGKIKADQAAKKANWKAWLLQEMYLAVCQGSLHSVTSLPPETRSNGTADLPASLAVLQNLRQERAALVENYITPYVAD